MAATEIWSATWIFYLPGGIERKVHNVITKRIPVRFHLNDKSAYKNALRDIILSTASTAKFINSLENDPDTGLKKFKIEYNTFISHTNE